MLRMMTFNRLDEVLGLSEAQLQCALQMSASSKRPRTDDEDYSKITCSIYLLLSRTSGWTNVDMVHSMS